MSEEASRVENPADRDEEYSKRFWAKGQPKGMRETMTENLTSAAKSGTFSVFTDKDGFSEKDRERISAYRILARELGYEIGPAKLNRGAGTATAEIRKIKK